MRFVSEVTIAVSKNPLTDLQNVVPDRSPPTLDVEVRVAVFHTDQTVFCDLWLPEQSIVRPVVFYPRQLPHDQRTLHDAAHPAPKNTNIHIE